MAPQTVLETERLRLTNWLPTQIDDLMRLHGDPEITRYLHADGHVETRDEAARRLKLWARLFAEHRLGKLRVERKSDGSFIGRAGFGIYPPTGEPEIGYAVLRRHWAKGYATEAASGLRDWLFAETDWDHFIGFADARNAASIAVLRRIGMIPTHVGEDAGITCRFHVLRREDLDG